MAKAKWWQIVLAILGGLGMAVAAVIFSYATSQSGVMDRCYTGIVNGGAAVICPPQGGK